LRLLTCEHAGNLVPPEYRAWFAGAEEALASHRGWDLGAERVLAALTPEWGQITCAHYATRLLADVNRSESNPKVFSEFSRAMPNRVRESVLVRVHRPHRARVRDAVEGGLTGQAQVIHVGVHTFTPVLRGRTRATAIGLLFDPGRPHEAAFVAELQTCLRSLLPGLRIHRNHPYRGTSDGLTTTLRQEFGPDYLGIELEVNQALVRGGPHEAVVLRGLKDAFRLMLMSG